MSEGISPAPVQNAASESITDPRIRSRELGADLQTGIAHHQAGRLDEAEALYRKLLDVVPDHPRALHLLGIIETERGRPERGVKLIGRAFPALARSADAHVDF